MKKKIFVVILLIIVVAIIINFLRIKSLNIEVPSFSYIIKNEGNYKITFYNFRKFEDIDNDISRYINKLSSCYDESYFFDKNNNITIKKYQVIKNKIFNKIILEYTKDNLCEDEYILDVNWYKDLLEKADVQEIVFDRCLEKCVSKKLKDFEEIYEYFFSSNLVRIENENIVSSKGEYILKIYYNYNKMNYVLEIFNESESYLVFNLIDANDHSENAIYLDEGNKLENLYN